MIPSPDRQVDVVLDTDTYNEIDDQFALAYAILSPERINLVGIHAAPFLNENSLGPGDGMWKSYREIGKVLALAGREDLQSIVYPGAELFLDVEEDPVPSPAATHLIELAREHSPEDPLYVVAIGAITNVASAILMDPSIVPSLVVIWLGGHGREYDHIREFNLWQDVPAARVVIGSGVPFVQLPCQGVVSHFLTTGPELCAWLVGKNELSTYLAENTIRAAERYAKGKPWSRVIWDVTAVAWLLNEDKRFLDVRTVDRLLPGYHGKYETEPIGTMDYVYSVHRDRLMEDLFSKLTGSASKEPTRD